MTQRLSDTLDSIARMGTLSDFEKTALRQAARTIRAGVGVSIEHEGTEELCNKCGWRYDAHPFGPMCTNFVPSGAFESTHVDAPERDYAASRGLTRCLVCNEVYGAGKEHLCGAPVSPSGERAIADVLDALIMELRMGRHGDSTTIAATRSAVLAEYRRVEGERDEARADSESLIKTMLANATLTAELRERDDELQGWRNRAWEEDGLRERLTVATEALRKIVADAGPCDDPRDGNESCTVCIAQAALASLQSKDRTNE